MVSHDEAAQTRYNLEHLVTCFVVALVVALVVLALARRHAASRYPGFGREVI